MRILVTGCVGFIGYNIIKKLIDKNNTVIGIDMINNYYDVNLKKKRLKQINLSRNKKNFSFYKFDISDIKKLNTIFLKHKIDIVVNLAAQAGVRDSITNPDIYLRYNINGFLNILELSKKYKVKHLVYASTSSVYGLNTKLPFKESDPTSHPMQFYAVTKKTNEIMAHAWSHLFNLPTTGLRFFTVYGPWGRPDMALYDFVDKIYNGKKINLYNKGNHIRDFTYVSDIVDGIILAISKIPKKSISKNFKEDSSTAPYQIFNLGSGQKVKLKTFLRIIEKNLNKKAKVNYLGMQPGDVHATIADIRSPNKLIKYKPKVKVKEGIAKFVEWYLDYTNSI